jgi:NAD(P)-dependent dehydrogenase (short-subunit alcohol dehydrogenase family)
MGDVDILINNAGASWGAPAEDHPVEAWDKVMNLNVRGYFLLSQIIAKKSMIPRKSGRIINVASIAGLGGNPTAMKTIAYNTSKGAVINFTRALAAEWGAYGINVNAICPGYIATEMNEDYFDTEQGRKLIDMLPRKRPGKPEDLDGLLLLLAAEEAHFINGAIITADDGMTAQ